MLNLINSIKAFLTKDAQNIANVIVKCEEDARKIQKILGKTKQIRYTTLERKHAVVKGYSNVKNFYV